MNSEDRRIREDERDASPERFPNPMVVNNERPTLQRGLTQEEREERREALSQQVTISSEGSSSSGSSFASSVQQQEMSISRLPTERENVDLSRHPTALSRIQTARSQHTYTVGTSLRSRTSQRNSTRPLPPFGAGKPYPPNLPEREEYVVEFDGPNDPYHAQNWPMKKKLPVAIVLGFVTLTASFGSSIFSAATRTVAAKFGVSDEVGILGVSLYVLGFSFGPIMWAPLSELYGRRLPLIISSFGFSLFSIATATGRDLQTVFLCRFFSGLFGACPLTCVAAVFADMFNNRQRGLAITVFSMTVFSAPLLAPFIGGFIDESSLGWRWTEYLVTIMGFTGLGLELLFLEETYPPVILVNKAADLRRRTKNWGIHAKQEEIEIDLRELLEKNLSRPLRMLFTEPIVLAISIYMSFIYGLLYLSLSLYPVVFQEIHGFSAGIGGLPFLGMVIGELLAGVYIILTTPSYNRKLAANNNVPIPEWRYPPVIAGGVVFAIGQFWFGWSGYKSSIPWIAPTLSGLFTGFGLMTLFVNLLNSLIETYLMFAASAIAGNTFLRSLAGAGFPLFATPMVDGLGVQWTGTLLGCVGLLLVPVPIMFYLKGAQLRERSNFAPTFQKSAEDAVPPSSADDDESGLGEAAPIEKVESAE